MITFTGAVARGCKSKLIIADMPFMSYQVNAEQALINAGRLLKEGRANAVKLEGGRVVAATVKELFLWYSCLRSFGYDSTVSKYLWRT